MESARLLELAIALHIHIHREPRPVPRLNLYFDGTQVTRSFAAFGSSYAPAIINDSDFHNELNAILSEINKEFCFRIDAV